MSLLTEDRRAAAGTRRPPASPRLGTQLFLPSRESCKLSDGFYFLMKAKKNNPKKKPLLRSFTSAAAAELGGQESIGCNPL